MSLATGREVGRISSIVEEFGPLKPSAHSETNIPEVSATMFKLVHLFFDIYLFVLFERQR